MLKVVTTHTNTYVEDGGGAVPEFDDHVSILKEMNYMKAAVIDQTAIWIAGVEVLRWRHANNKCCGGGRHCGDGGGDCGV